MQPSDWVKNYISMALLSGGLDKTLDCPPPSRLPSNMSTCGSQTCLSVLSYREAWCHDRVTLGGWSLWQVWVCMHMWMSDSRKYVHFQPMLSVPIFFSPWSEVYTCEVKWLLFSLNKAMINIKTDFHFCVVKYHIPLQAPLSVRRQWSYWSVRKTLSAAGASKPSQSRPTLSSITPYHDQPGRLGVKLVWCVQL